MLNDEFPEKVGKEIGTGESRYRLKLRGIIFGEGPHRIATMARVMAGLENSPLFEDVKLLSTEENGEYSEPGDEFELLCMYRSGEDNVNPRLAHSKEEVK